MRSILKPISVIASTGVLLGALTSFGQTYIPEPFTQLANSYSIWLLFSFAIGILLRDLRYGIVAVGGIAVQYLAILFYYVASSIRFNMSYSLSSLISLNLVWLIGGTLVGPLAGACGKLVASGSKYLFAAVGFMAGLIFSEAAYQFSGLNYPAEGIVFMTAGLIFMGWVYYQTKYPVVKSILATIVFAVVMYFGYAKVLPSFFS